MSDKEEDKVEVVINAFFKELTKPTHVHFGDGRMMLGLLKPNDTYPDTVTVAICEAAHQRPIGPIDDQDLVETDDKAVCYLHFSNIESAQAVQRAIGTAVKAFEGTEGKG